MAPTNVSLAQSPAVAGLALKQLGLNESATTFLAGYTVTSQSSQVLLFTVNANSSADAVRRAPVLADSFLKFRAKYLNEQLQTEQTSLNQQVTQAEQQVNSLNQEIAAQSDAPGTSAQQGKLASLHTQLTNAQNVLYSVQQNATGTVAAARATVAMEINGSQPLSAPTPVHASLKNGAVFYIFVAFFVGLLLGMVIIIIRTLTTDRMRRRDEVAEFIGAPVRLSVRSRPGRRRWRIHGRRRASQNLDMRRLVTHLGGLATQFSGALPQGSRRLKGLVIVAVDNTEEVASAVVELASVNADRGRK